MVVVPFDDDILQVKSLHRTGVASSVGIRRGVTPSFPGSAALTAGVSENLELPQCVHPSWSLPAAFVVTRHILAVTC